MKKEGRQRKIRFSTVILLVIIVILAGAIAAGYLWGGTIFDIKSRTTQLQLKDIGEIATQAAYFTNVQSISGSREIFGVPVPFTQSRYIYSYNGVIKAGMDFSKITLRVNELLKKVTVTLPEAVILSVELDEDSLTVYDEKDSIFTPLKVETLNESMMTLKDQARMTAIENGILENALENAKQLLRGFLAGSFDLTEYEIVFEEAAK